MLSKPISKGILLLLFGTILIFFSLGYYVGRPTQRELCQQYERGVHLVAEYKKCFNYLPSRWFRDVAFEWGDPQNQADLDSIDSIVDWEIINQKRYELGSAIHNEERIRIAFSKTIRYLKSLPGYSVPNKLHDEYTRGAATAIDYQHERNSPPSGNWLDAAFEYGYITDKYDFNEVDKAVINRVSNSNKARYDKADTTVKIK